MGNGIDRKGYRMVTSDTDMEWVELMGNRTDREGIRIAHNATHGTKYGDRKWNGWGMDVKWNG